MIIYILKITTKIVFSTKSRVHQHLHSGGCFQRGNKTLQNQRKGKTPSSCLDGGLATRRCMALCYEDKGWSLIRVFFLLFSPSSHNVSIFKSPVLLLLLRAAFSPCGVSPRRPERRQKSVNNTLYLYSTFHAWRCPKSMTTINHNNNWGT